MSSEVKGSRSGRNTSNLASTRLRIPLNIRGAHIRLHELRMDDRSPQKLRVSLRCHFQEKWYLVGRGGDIQGKTVLMQEEECLERKGLGRSDSRRRSWVHGGQTGTRFGQHLGLPLCT